MGLEGVVNYRFEWENTQNGIVMNHQVQELRMVSSAPAPGRRVSPHLREKFEGTKEGKRLLGGRHLNSMVPTPMESTFTKPITIRSSDPLHIPTDVNICTHGPHGK